MGDLALSLGSELPTHDDANWHGYLRLELASWLMEPDANSAKCGARDLTATRLPSRAPLTRPENHPPRAGEVRQRSPRGSVHSTWRPASAAAAIAELMASCCGRCLHNSLRPRLTAQTPCSNSTVSGRAMVPRGYIS